MSSLFEHDVNGRQEEGDAPADQYGLPEREFLEFQMAVLGEGHEDVGQGQQQNGADHVERIRLRKYYYSRSLMAISTPYQDTVGAGSRCSSITSLNTFFGKEPGCIIGMPVCGMNKKVGMLWMPKTAASSCSTSVFTL
jgi:hypothetical protein